MHQGASTCHRPVPLRPHLARLAAPRPWVRRRRPYTGKRIHATKRCPIEQQCTHACMFSHTVPLPSRPHPDSSTHACVREACCIYRTLSMRYRYRPATSCQATAPLSFGDARRGQRRGGVGDHVPTHSMQTPAICVESPPSSRQRRPVLLVDCCAQQRASPISSWWEPFEGLDVDSGRSQ